MNTRHRLTLLGLALGTLLALLLVPQTRWLVRLQTLTLLHQYHPLPTAWTGAWTGGSPAYYTTSEANDTRLYSAAAARHPDDFALQYARAALSGNDAPLMRLRALTQRFPDSPILYANLLREECRRLHAARSEDYLLQNQPVPSKVPDSSAPTPEDLAAYDQEAAAGERADPANAYFPFMRAFGLFVAYRDAEALAAVKRASVKPRWNEYLTENVQAKWDLHTEAFSDPGALPQAALWSGELLPEYQRLRETAHIAVYQAVLKEEAGHREEGYQLREALRRCGDIMRVQSTTLIGSLVGIAISTISETRPGGPYLQDSADRRGQKTPEQMAQKRLDAYCAYAVRIGHPEAAQRAQEEETARRRVQGLTKDDPQMLKYVAPLWYLAFWWTAGVALLLNVGWLLALGLAAAGYARRPASEKPPTGWKTTGTQIALALGFWLLLALSAIFFGDCWVDVTARQFYWPETVGVLGVLGLLLWLVVRVMRRIVPSERKAALWTAALLPVLVGAVYGFYALTLWLAGPLAEILANLRLLMGAGSGDSDTEQARQTQALQLYALASVAVPLLLTASLSVAALVRRVSWSRALTTGFQQLAVPLACLLVIAYGGILLGTLRQERSVAAFNQQMISNSGRYFAAQAGQAWPGPVP